MIIGEKRGKNGNNERGINMTKKTNPRQRQQ